VSKRRHRQDTYSFLHCYAFARRERDIHRYILYISIYNIAICIYHKNMSKCMEGRYQAMIDQLSCIVWGKLDVCKTNLRRRRVHSKQSVAVSVSFCVDIWQRRSERSTVGGRPKCSNFTNVGKVATLLHFAHQPASGLPPKCSNPLLHFATLPRKLKHCDRLLQESSSYLI